MMFSELQGTTATVWNQILTEEEQTRNSTITL